MLSLSFKPDSLNRLFLLVQSSHVSYVKHTDTDAFPSVYIIFYQPIICNSNQCSFPHICKCKYLILPADIGFVAWNLIFSSQDRMSGIFKVMFSIILLFLLLTHLFSLHTEQQLVQLYVLQILQCYFCCGTWNILYIHIHLNNFNMLICVPVKAIKLHLLSEWQKSEYFFGIAIKTQSILNRTILFQEFWRNIKLKSLTKWPVRTGWSFSWSFSEPSFSL